MDGRSEQTLLMDEPQLTCASLYVGLGICQLNQWALDFDGNCDRILKSIELVRERGGHYRLGPELEITGYSCDDHFLESDTTSHSWQTVKRIITSGLSHNCLIDVGMPVEHKSARFNCRIFLLNDKILLIRPKMILANDGNYREVKWFAPWPMKRDLDEFTLPKSVQKVTGQSKVPFGFAVVECNDCSIASETCEELFCPQSPHISLCLDGVDIFSNGSGSHHELRKLEKRIKLILNVTQKLGGVYMYSNSVGADAGRLYFDGASFISSNGRVEDILPPFSLRDVDVIVSQVNLTRVRSYRAAKSSLTSQSSGCFEYHRIPANIWLSGQADSSVRVLRMPSYYASFKLPCWAEECGLGPACWLWDYLRRSGASGFLVPLSGGADSGAVSTMVYHMCVIVMNEVHKGAADVIASLEKVIRTKFSEPSFPKTVTELCFRLFHTVFLSTEYSSNETRSRAEALSKEIGSYHVEMCIDPVVTAGISMIQNTFDVTPHFAKKFPKDGEINGTFAEDRALQNLQARTRMVSAYLLAGLLPWLRASDPMAPPPKNPLSSNSTGCSLSPEDEVSKTMSINLTDEQKAKMGYILVLSCGNVDETLRGYFTKYDCSSGDLNPIGSMSKIDLRGYLHWAASNFNLPALEEIIAAQPTAELKPCEVAPTGVILRQTDEEEMGLTYDQLALFGKLRKVDLAGPVEMFELLMQDWKKERDDSAKHGGRMAERSVGRPGPENEEEMKAWLHYPEVTPKYLADKVKLFFRTYGQNRHKTMTLPNTYHAEQYSVDEKRFDWRPVLYPELSLQFRHLDNLAQQAEESLSPRLNRTRPTTSGS